MEVGEAEDDGEKDGDDDINGSGVEEMSDEEDRVRRTTLRVVMKEE